MTPDDRSSRRILVGVAALLGAGAVGASPWEGYRLFLRGLLEERAGRPAAAAEMYENVLKRDPEAPAVRAALVEACLAAGRWDAALQTARSLADGFPESVEFQILLGRAYLAAGQSDKAQGAFDRALSLVFGMQVPPAAAPRPLAERIRGALRLLRGQTLALALQLASLLGAILWRLCQTGVP